jgi:two-component system response regulator LytT
MNVAILENDHRTVKILENLLKKISSTIKVVCKIESIEKSLLWFETNPNPDLILLNTSLSDGSSFEIFKSKVILSPLIFVSSTSEFAIQSYKLNCVDYLLKPIKKEEFQFAFNKFNFKFSNSETVNSSLQKLKGLK